MKSFREKYLPPANPMTFPGQNSCNFMVKLVRQEAMLCIANELPLPFGVILPGCAFVVMQRCKAPGTM